MKTIIIDDKKYKWINIFCLYIYINHHPIYSTELPDSLLPSIPIIHHLWKFYLVCILYLYRADVNTSGQPTLVHPCAAVHKWMLLMSSSWFLKWCPAHLIHLTWMVCEIGEILLYTCRFLRWCFQELFKLHGTFLQSSHLAFSSSVLFMSMWCIHIVVWTQVQLEGNPVLFYWIDKTFIRSIACQ